MTTMDAAAPPGGRARPLTDGDLTAAWWVGAAAAALGVLGFVNSFRAVARAAVSSFGELAPTVPLGIDLAIAVFSALDIVLARLDMRPRWVRLVPWTLTGATIYLNVAGQVTWFGRIAHAVFPALWVVAVSLAAHVIRIRAQLAAGTRMDRVRVSRWVLAPLPTARLWRRMVLWEIRSYPAALDRERARVLALTGLQDAYGVLAWRWRAPRRVRALYRLGDLDAAGDSVTGNATPAGLAGQRDARTEDDVHAETAAVRAARIEIQREALGGAVRDPRGDARTGGPPGPAGRDAVVALIAEEIRDAIEAGERWHPDYPALMASTGRRRSWCEKAVRDARMTVLDSPDDRTDDAASPRTDGAAPGARTEPGGAAGEPRTDDDPDSAGERTGELALAGAP
jgi:hypothetical protein